MSLSTTLGGALRRLNPTRRKVGIAAALALSLIAVGLGGRLLAGPSQLDTLGPMPELSGAVQWLNSPALDREALKGKVVLVDFWTYDCINCQRSLPYVNNWAKRYADQGLVVIGVHTPEYDYENDIDNVRGQVAKLGIEYPVAIDNRYAIWNAFGNQFWPAHYFVDARGQVRFVHFGEGAYDTQEQVIQQLLAEQRGLAP
ncbi:thioredoxin family protein [Pseudomonas alkylphenolica]|uniref:Cytochrome C biogenesis domain protein/antioxidant, AhpC/TSA family n=1 Tax=Pseudomonas alkylphenolica TaxID=237609 RepID=A0A077F9K1_9PSED|nr:thioredoxin family protein [Pseudomonas alkylphenolica]AIL62018.1 cytochrome C biogenesis domain protein/antioxidant, AhpC/TSA family [Pseudomonas alkylphenolica]